MSKQYFANLPQAEIAKELDQRVNTFYEEIERNGRLALWRRAHRFYYALNEYGYHEASKIRRGGDSGQLSILKANHFRNLIQHLHVLVTQQRPAFDCRAINTDTKSQIQTILGKNILEYYWREKRLDVDSRQAAEVAILYGEAYAEISWDKAAGDPVAGDIESEQVITTGDVTTRIHEPINVVRPIRTDQARSSWYILRNWEERHELAAAHPKYAEYIQNYSAETGSKDRYYYGYDAQSGEDTEDLIPVFYFYHDRTKACRTGRRAVFLGPDVCLEVGPLDTPTLPVYPMIPSRQHGMSFGYTIAFDLMCVQEAIDMMYSTIMSNQAAFGVQNIWMKPGSNLIPSQLGGGLNILQSPEKPEAINLTNTAAETFKFLQELEKLSEVLSGVNSVARGQPEASLKSGAALALVASQAVQFSNGLQAAFSRLLEDCGTAILRTLQTRATLPRAAVIAGKSNKSYIKDFTGDDLKSINRVIVDLGNPVSRTIAGRIQMADSLLQNGGITKPEQYIQIIETGNTDVALEERRAEEILIDSENEALREGKPVVATAIDEHVRHIKQHRAVLAGTEERMDPALVERVLSHINEHIQHLSSTNPSLLNILGMAPIATQPNGQPTPPQGANAPQPNAAPDQAQQGPTPPGEPVPPPPGSSPDIAANMPTMPTAPQGAA